MMAAHPAAWGTRRALFLAGGMLLLAGATLGRHALESSMASHMLVQMPAIFLSGALAAAAMAGAGHPAAGLRRLRQYDEHGLPGLLLISFLLAYWMIPKAIDHVLLAPGAEAAKFASLFAGGLIAKDCLARANRVIQLFFLGNIAWMMAIAGLLYQDNATRLCNFYLLDDQVLAGQGLVLLSVALPVLWVWRQLRRHSGRPLA
ncbi:MAG TPA: hypothetical protein VL051_00645 [Burkholderiaceae bacterium]|nr:hypothetical protein [Burkholderiaceae bacterium]